MNETIKGYIAALSKYDYKVQKWYEEDFSERIFLLINQIMYKPETLSPEQIYKLNNGLYNNKDVEHAIILSPDLPANIKDKAVERYLSDKTGYRVAFPIEIAMFHKNIDKGLFRYLYAMDNYVFGYHNFQTVAAMYNQFPDNDTINKCIKTELELMNSLKPPKSYREDFELFRHIKDNNMCQYVKNHMPDFDYSAEQISTNMIINDFVSEEDKNFFFDNYGFDPQQLLHQKMTLTPHITKTLYDSAIYAATNKEMLNSHDDSSVLSVNLLETLIKTNALSEDLELDAVKKIIELNKDESKRKANPHLLTVALYSHNTNVLDYLYKHYNNASLKEQVCRNIYVGKDTIKNYVHELCIKIQKKLDAGQSDKIRPSWLSDVNAMESKVVLFDEDYQTILASKNSNCIENLLLSAKTPQSVITQYLEENKNHKTDAKYAYRDALLNTKLYKAGIKDDIAMRAMILLIKRSTKEYNQEGDLLDFNAIPQYFVTADTFQSLNIIKGVLNKIDWRPSEGSLDDFINCLQTCIEYYKEEKSTGIHHRDIHDYRYLKDKNLHDYTNFIENNNAMKYAKLNSFAEQYEKYNKLEKEQEKLEQEY